MNLLFYVFVLMMMMMMNCGVKCERFVTVIVTQYVQPETVTARVTVWTAQEEPQTTNTVQLTSWLPTETLWESVTLGVQSGVAVGSTTTVGTAAVNSTTVNSTVNTTVNTTTADTTVNTTSVDTTATFNSTTTSNSTTQTTSTQNTTSQTLPENTSSSSHANSTAINQMLDRFPFSNPLDAAMHHILSRVPSEETLLRVMDNISQWVELQQQEEKPLDENIPRNKTH